MKVAIITVNYNGKKDTLDFLGSLNKLQTENWEVKTIVVDNASEDGLISELVKNYPEVVILQNGINKGFAGGFNRGIDYGQIWGADYFLLINNDCLIKDENLLDELIKTTQSDPEIGLISPKIYFAPGFEFHKNRYEKKNYGQVIWYAGGHFDWDNIGSVHLGVDEVDKGKYDGVKETKLISGACMLIKKEVLEKVGLFDERYFLYFEDSDFQIRVREAGFKTYYNGKIAIYHKVSQSTGIGSPTTDYYHTRNKLIFGMKYAKLRTKFALLREALKLLIFGRKAQRQGILDFYLGIREGVNLNHPEVFDSEGLSPQAQTRRGGIALHPRVEYPLKLSIGVVSYNTADLTKKLLQSIFEKNSGFDPDQMEVIVLDNGSKDNCKLVIKEFLSRINYLENKENEGFSKGYNKTIRYSQGEYYLMLNSDIEVLKNGLFELVKAAVRFKGNAVLGGKLFFPDGGDQDSVFHLPTLTGAFKEYFLKQKGSYFMYLPKSDQPVRVEGLVMACFLVPRKIVDRVGFLDEGTFIFFEDIEYCKRLKNFGVPLFFVPSAKFVHLHGASTKRIGQKKANELLQESAKHYHGKFYFLLLYLILRLGQKLGRVKTPVSRWIEE